MNKGKTMYRNNTWYKAVVVMMALVMLVLIMPLSVSAGNETTGTIGDNGGITWTYDGDTTTLILSGKDRGSWGVDVKDSFYKVSVLTEKCPNVSKIVVEDLTIVGDASYFFAGFESLKDIEFEKIDTSQVTNMQGMFQYCKQLKKLDLRGFDTSQVTMMTGMFNVCTELNSIDVSNFDTSQVTIMAGMFADCSALSNVDVSCFDTVQVTSMNGMFVGCNSLSGLDLSSFNTANVTSMASMFYDCSNLKNINISGFEISNANITAWMFGGCETLDSIHTPKAMAEGQSIDLPATFKDSKQNSTAVVTSEFCNDILTRDINPFSDIKETSWQYASAKYAYDKSLMAGKGQDNEGNIIFDPNKPIPREEFVQVLYNASGKPAVNIENKFPDVKNAWYKNAVLWANANDIANGKGNGDFGVTESISRQDLALMLYKYARMNGYDLTANAGEINKYADGNKVSNYAKTAMDWAITKGVMSGKGTKGEDISTFKLDPTGTATRAECAAMLKNFMEAYGE